MTDVIKPARKRWSDLSQERIERPDIDAFLEDVIAVCERHGFGLSHEDYHGAFIVVSVEDFKRDWLRDAFDGTKEKAS